MSDELDTADMDEGPSPPEPQPMQGQAAPCQKPPLRQRVRDVLERLKPFPACD